METKDEILAELKEIRRIINLLAFEKREELRKKAAEEWGITTKVRQRMFSLMDGQRSLAEIAKATNTSATAVRKFCATLERKGVIRWHKKGAAKCPEAIVSL